MADFTASLVGFGFLSRRALAQITIPGIQNPHCTAPALEKAYTYIALSLSDKPSAVSILFPSSLSVFCTQAFTAFPSINTVHVPHAPSLHPFFTDVSLRVSLKNDIRLMFSVTVYVTPFTVNTAILSLSLLYLRPCYHLCEFYSRMLKTVRYTI